MLRHFLSQFGRARHLLVALALMLLALLPGVSFAQSACTAMWGIVTTGGAAPARLGYYNGSLGTAQKFTTLTFTLAGGTQANALAGDPATGILYYFDRTGLNLGSANINTGVTATVGTIAPAAPGGNANILGAVIDQSSNLIMMASNANVYYLSMANKAGNTTSAVWQSVTYTVGLGSGAPASGGSGDVYIDKNNQIWLVSNTTPTALYPLTVTFTAGSPGTITSVVSGASVTYATGPATVQGVSVLPTTGLSYLAGVTTNKIAYSFLTGSANSEILVDASPATLYTVTDMGNCVLTPAAPTISKSITPTYAPLGSPNTATLVVAITNSNTAPIWLTQTLTDTFPAGLTVAPIPNLSTGACATSSTVTNVITATAGATTFTFATGGRIPAGGCTITFSVTGPPATGAYTNTIAAGALMTTAGANVAAASATYKVGTDFAAGKSQCVGVCGTTSTGVVTIGGGQTVQYIVTITNSAGGGTGSAAFTDTFPSLMTPVLSITAAMVGGGSCTTASSVVSGATVVTGTLTNALAGAQCTIIATSLVSTALTVATNVTNTVTLSPLSGTSDTVNTNNTATVPTIVGPSANLSVSKTNNVSSLVAGSTTSYTITVANIGPAAAPGTVLKDPAATGLSCTTVSCAVTAGVASCPSPLTMNGLQVSGLTITPSFNANSTLSFKVTCGVTATGQ